MKQKPVYIDGQELIDALNGIAAAADSAANELHTLRSAIEIARKRVNITVAGSDPDKVKAFKDSATSSRITELCRAALAGDLWARIEVGKMILGEGDD